MLKLGYEKCQYDKDDKDEYLFKNEILKILERGE